MTLAAPHLVDGPESANATLPTGRVMPKRQAFACLLLSGRFGGMAQIMMMLAPRNGKVSRRARLDDVALVCPVHAELTLVRVANARTFVLALPLTLAGAAPAAIEGLHRQGKAA